MLAQNLITLAESATQINESLPSDEYFELWDKAIERREGDKDEPRIRWLKHWGKESGKDRFSAGLDALDAGEISPDVLAGFIKESGKSGAGSLFPHGGEIYYNSLCHGYHSVRAEVPVELHILCDLKSDNIKKALEIVKKELASIDSASVHAKKVLSRVEAILSGYLSVADDYAGFIQKVKSLPVVGVATAKVSRKDQKSNAAAALPVSPNFKDYLWAKYFSIKVLTEIVKVIPEMDKALEIGYASSKELRSWGSLFYKGNSDELSALRRASGKRANGGDGGTGSCYNDESTLENFTHYDKDEKVIAFMTGIYNDFSSLREVWGKVNKLRTKVDQEMVNKVNKYRKTYNSDSHKLLETTLTSIIDSIIVEYEEGQYEYHLKESYTDPWKNLIGVLGGEKEITGEEIDDMFRKERPQRRDSTKIEHYVEIPKWLKGILRHDHPFLVKSDYRTYHFLDKYPTAVCEELARKVAHEEAVGVRNHFISKNLGKLGALLSIKPLETIRTDDVSVADGAVHSQMTFLFKDESSFEVRNKVVTVRSTLGKFFARYPTTFHNIKVEGEAMRSPSEERVYRVFGDQAAPKEDKETVGESLIYLTEQCLGD